MKKMILPTAFIALFSTIFIAKANAQSSANPTPEATYKSMDSNKDNFVTKAELKAHYKKNHHDALDTNKDGKISRAEVSAVRKDPELLKKVDKDNDGQVSFEEGYALEEERFKAADKNHDGKVSKAEFDGHVVEVKK